MKLYLLGNRKFIIFILLISLFFFQKNVFADPTALFRVLNSEIILNGPRAGGMGQASTAVASPAFLPDAPKVFSVDFGYTAWDTKVGSDGNFYVESFGIVLPVKKWSTTFAIRGLNFNTDEFGAQKSDFTPVGSTVSETKAKEMGLLFAVGKKITDNFSIGVAQPIYYNTEVEYKGDNGKIQKYELKDKLGPGIFLRRDAFKWLDIGVSYWNHRSKQVYKGDDFNGKATAKHEELRTGIAIHPDEFTTFAFDFERHRTDAPLHSLVGVHEHFDWSNRWYTGIERWFKINSLMPNFAIRIGLFDEESITGGLSYRIKILKMPAQIDFTFVKDHSIHEFEKHEPGMYGDGALSGFLTVNLIFR